ncbi:MAG: hypothetical protein A2275_11255 [Bacteroidetes bacterium RIFOXYA12_FULL_35_11]|nr:MAG: hypothetical protein A2X01_19200 [Bacteroidetes bacterium GWF2_35_48]OFY74417.1 MAG: hypothetical protein A2275_11255 [Bacteroidetes bacterium RIFOXYA12_FULL_35_11]OFY96455.1 MAG: hypothetical protein A2309_12205 [Bacteroidetes bacterium RIFOXYB2_FULL_35_7]OFZ00582.1 MAG: hypothetical protein A2491_17435 [Bacteroidetes bacterium RIFOXYC12_FULL_35_7]HBX50706.1 hypothetical protein [Bacteroidales bacterium]
MTWLNTYLQEKKSFFEAKENESLFNFSEHSNSLDEFLLNQFHETGFLYGSPVSLIFNHSFPENTFNKNEELFIFLLDTFFFIWKNNDEKYENNEKYLSAFADSVISFYDCVIPRLTDAEKNTTNSFEKLKNITALRVQTDDLFVKYNYTGYLYNSLLCIDILMYAAWLKDSGSLNRDTFEMILLSFLKIITSAGNADEKILGNAEKLLLGNFIRSLSLKEKHEEIALKNITHETTQHFYDSLFLPSPALKIMAFEFALIVVLSDAVISDTEKIFIDRMAKQLEIKETEAEKYLSRIESFVYNNWDNRVTDDKISFRFLKNGIQKRIEKILTKNKQKLIQELNESKELLQLLNKYSQQNLTPEEKKKVKEQLLDMLRTIPSLAIFLLPGGALILPVLLKIIPKEYLLPSSFRENQE